MKDVMDKQAMTDRTTKELIDTLFSNFAVFLKEKNDRYGDSALHPAMVFSKVSSNVQLCNRLDDKLNRIKTAPDLNKNDVADVLGYIALLMIQKGWLSFDDILE